MVTDHETKGDDMLEVIHPHASTGDAYNACQTEEYHARGDTLLVTTEGVVGVADTWPIAVTEFHGDLHEVIRWEEYLEAEPGMLDGVKRAMKLAMRLRYPLAPGLNRYFAATAEAGL